MSTTRLLTHDEVSKSSYASKIRRTAEVVDLRILTESLLGNQRVELSFGPHPNLAPLVAKLNESYTERGFSTSLVQQGEKGTVLTIHWTFEDADNNSKEDAEERS